MGDSDSFKGLDLLIVLPSLGWLQVRGFGLGTSSFKVYSSEQVLTLISAPTLTFLPSHDPVQGFTHRQIESQRNLLLKCR